jgi:hypothetical protein
MSDWESFNVNELEEIVDEDGAEEVIRTIPLHPCLLRGKNIITDRNYRFIQQTVEIVTESVEEWGPSISYVRKEFITYDLCKKAIANNSDAISCIRRELLTEKEYYDLCLQTVTDNGWRLKEVPQSLQTQELCDAAIKRSCWAIEFCRDEFKTEANCLSAVRRNGQTIHHVPRRFVTSEMCMAATKSPFVCLEFIPREFLTHEICEEAVRSNGESIKVVPEEFMSSKLAYLAVTTPRQYDSDPNCSGVNIQFIPGKFLNKEIIVESARRWHHTYSTIPKECLTEEIEDAVLDVAPFCIRHMKQTPEKVMRAIRVNPCSIAYVEEANRTAEMATYILGLPSKMRKRISEEVLENVMSILRDAP